MPASQLQDFVKALYPLAGLDRGTLQINLEMIAKRFGKNVPVIVSTGPAGSITDRRIRQVVEAHNRFSLGDLTIMSQDERLHLTVNGRIVWARTESGPQPRTNPDETGGPLVKLARGGVMERLRERGCRRLLVLQGIEILSGLQLPDYATPPKEMTPDRPSGLKAPKIGFAATDVLPLAKHPAVLATTPDRFAVIKDDGDLKACGELVRGFGLP